MEGKWGKRELQHQIERKAFERAEIADSKLALAEASHLGGSFKDPYFLDFLGLKEGYLEDELENALLKELELFILELGKGFTFVERQKRMIIDSEEPSYFAVGYQEAVIALSHQPFVTKVAVQTNLAWNTRWLARCNQQTTALWATYHPDFVSAIYR